MSKFDSRRVDVKRLTAVLTAGLVLMLSSGCAVRTGNEKLARMDKREIEQRIVKGKTTKEEVRRLMGDPDKVDFDQAGHEKWEYINVHRSAKAINYVPVANWFVQGTNDTKKTLIVIFDDNGVVLNHAFSRATGETSGGLFQ